MDSTGVYDSGNASDSESWSSSEAEQVIEISSHSRILISPKKTRGSTWDNKLQCKDKKSLSMGKKKSSRPRLDQDIPSPRPQTRRRSYQARKSKSAWVGSPPKPSSDNQSMTSSNNDDISESDEDVDTGRGGSASSDDSDASDEANIESPGHRRVSRVQNPKGIEKFTSKMYEYSLGDSIRPHGSPTTPGQEMEELKATLKKLARHDSSDEKSSLHKEPNISSATVLHEYLTAATSLNGMNAVAASNQTRPIEHTGMKTRQDKARLSRSNSYMSSGSLKTISKSMQENESDAKLRTDTPPDKLAGSTGNSIGVGSERLTFDRRIFSTPPPPFGGPGRYTAGLALPLQNMGGGVSSGGAQGSRAVLSALKALQDKIGRLEEERESLMQQLSDAKLTARKREAELASSEKKFSYELGQTKESARAAYDALRCDREELKLLLVKSEERRKATQHELQHFQELTKNLSMKADDLQSQLQISESHRTRLKAELNKSENEHKRAVNELQAELTQTRQELQTAVERNELVEAQFQRESANHAESRERLKDSEQTMASISQLNEKLVAKAMEATEAANQALKKNKKLQQQIRPSTLHKPTAASRASAAVNVPASRRTANSTMSQGDSGISPARTLKKKKTSAGATSSATKKKVKSSNNMTLLREANLGKDIPFLLGNSVQPSFSIIGNIQDALRRCDTTYVMPTLLSDSVPITPESTSSLRQTAKKVDSPASIHTEINNLQVDADFAQPFPPRDSHPPVPINEDATTAGTISQTPASTAIAQCHMPPAIKVPTVSPKTYASPMQSQIMEDLHAAVESADKEFDGLNKRYKDLVTQMEVNNRRGGQRSEHDKANSSTSTQLSQALGPLLDELEAKAKQLNLLKQVYQQAASSTINPQRHVVVSPAAIRRKTASLRVLNEYRQLEGAFKNKGSGRSGTLSHLAGDTSFH